jgi:mannose-6-phosphate isomerase-like protein (cupin superfamily)
MTHDEPRATREAMIELAVRHMRAEDDADTAAVMATFGATCEWADVATGETNECREAVHCHYAERFDCVKTRSTLRDAYCDEARRVVFLEPTLVSQQLRGYQGFPKITGAPLPLDLVVRFDVGDDGLLVREVAFYDELDLLVAARVLPDVRTRAGRAWLAAANPVAPLRAAALADALAQGATLDGAKRAKPPARPALRGALEERAWRMLEAEITGDLDALASGLAEDVRLESRAEGLSAVGRAAVRKAMGEKLRAFRLRADVHGVFSDERRRVVFVDVTWRRRQVAATEAHPLVHAREYAVRAIVKVGFDAAGLVTHHQTTMSSLTLLEGAGRLPDVTSLAGQAWLAAANPTVPLRALWHAVTSPSGARRERGLGERTRPGKVIYDSKLKTRAVFVTTADSGPGHYMEVDHYYAPRSGKSTPHRHEYDMHYEVFSGEGTYVVEGQVFKLRAGEKAVIPAGAHHQDMHNETDEILHDRLRIEGSYEVVREQELAMETTYGFSREGRADARGLPELLQQAVTFGHGNVAFAPRVAIDLQKRVFRAAADLANRLGYRYRYDRFSGVDDPLHRDD